jgi:holo-[acyl-carrier protein] synthase
VIIGIGSDLCNIERIEKVARAVRRPLPRPRLHRCRAAKAASAAIHRAGTLAKRFAAKEAFSKAVGTGFKRGVFMKDIGVVNLPSASRRCN